MLNYDEPILFRVVGAVCLTYVALTASAARRKSVTGLCPLPPRSINRRPFPTASYSPSREIRRIRKP